MHEQWQIGDKVSMTDFRKVRLGTIRATSYRMTVRIGTIRGKLPHDTWTIEWDNSPIGGATENVRGSKLVWLGMPI